MPAPMYSSGVRAPACSAPSTTSGICARTTLGTYSLPSTSSRHGMWALLPSGAQDQCPGLWESQVAMEHPQNAATAVDLDDVDQASARAGARDGLLRSVVAVAARSAARSAATTRAAAGAVVCGRRPLSVRADGCLCCGERRVFDAVDGLPWHPR